MQVKWKLLVSLGAIFFVSLCVKEQLGGNILEEGEFSKLQGDTSSQKHDLLKPAYSSEPIVEGGKEKEEEKTSEQSYRWNQNTLWSIFITLTFCGVGYLVKAMKAKEPPEIEEPLMEDKKDFGVSTSNYDIITLCAPKLEECYRETEECAQMGNRLMDAVKDFSIKVPQIENNPTAKPEKKYINLKEQMADLQLSSWKEYGVLSKKLEAVSKDKRQLTKQLKEAQKENELLRQRLEDAVADRSSLIKKLESATKEIKASTQSKQQTLVRLEEAITTTNHLKERLAQVFKEKEALEEQLRAIELQHEVLKEQSKEFRISLDKYDRSSVSLTPAMTESEANMKESAKNIEKVQHKLNDLENSLVKMKELGSAKTSSCNVDNVSETDDASSTFQEKSFEQRDSVSSEKLRDSVEKSRSKIPVRQKSENSLPEKNKGEESNSADSSEESESCRTCKPDLVPETTETPTENPKVVRMSERGVEFNASTSTLRTDSCTSTDYTEDESKSKFTPGIVSQSPAFQQFLIKVMDSPINCT